MKISKLTIVVVFLLPLASWTAYEVTRSYRSTKRFKTHYYYKFSTLFICCLVQRLDVRRAQVKQSISPAKTSTRKQKTSAKWNFWRNLDVDLLERWCKFWNYSVTFLNIMISSDPPLLIMTIMAITNYLMTACEGFTVKFQTEGWNFCFMDWASGWGP